MKSILKGLILFAVITILSFLMPGLMDSTKYSIQAGEAEWSDDETVPEQEDAFTIVEILPYRGMDEIGYLIGGQEPVDQELMNYSSASGDLSFLGGAISVYGSYEVKTLPASGTLDAGWSLTRTEVIQNGYFEEVGYNQNGARYVKKTYGENYARVADGTGNYAAVLNDGTEMGDITSWEFANKRNVNAYFVYGKPSGVAIFNASTNYEPYSVKLNTAHTGDYDYDVSTKHFYLNQGKGKYDIIFKKSSGGSNGGYYILKDKLQIVEDSSGTYSFQLSYVSKTGGNYVRETAEYYTFDKSGNYRWTQSNEALNKPSNYYKDGTGKIWAKNQRIMVDYEFRLNVQLVNNEWFKTKALGVPASQVDHYPVKIIAITPDDLNKPENQHYIDEADLFYINANYNHNYSYLKLYEQYSYEGLSLPASEKYYTGSKDKTANLNFAIHDLSWDNVTRIFKRAAGIGCNKAALIFDDIYVQDALNGSNAYSSLKKDVTVPYKYNGTSATMCNLAKLYIMVYQRNMVDFYNSFLQTSNPTLGTKLITKVSTTVNKTGSTGSFVRPDMPTLSPTADEALYWNSNTFLPFGLDSTGRMVMYSDKYWENDALVANGIYNFNLTATTTDLTNNVLSTNGMDIFTSKFMQPLYIPSDSQEEAVTHLSSLNGGGTIVNANSITIADLANVITNNGNGFENIGGTAYPDGSGVEGPQGDSPDEDAGDTTDDGLDGSGIRSYKRVLNIQPTADFAASEASIRTILSGFEVQIVDMTSTQFNGSIEDINAMYDMIFMGSSFGRFNLNSGNTVFNTSSLNGYYYFVNGDLRLIGSGSGLNKNYHGNDITAQKKLELADYLDAGYPVVLNSALYDMAGVMNSTNIKSFISQSKSSHPYNFLNLNDFYNNRITFKSRLKAALEVTRPLISLTGPVVAQGASVNYIYVDPATDRLSIKFALLPKGKNPSAYTYNAYLYLDEGGDGIFDESELLDVISNDGSSSSGLKESRYHTCNFSYNMAAYNGTYQWKLVVKRSDNEDIHSVVTGYTANTNKENIYVLQIRDNASAFNLENRVNDAASLVYKYAGQNKLKDYNIIFDTLTVQEFQQLYADAPYTTATAAQANKLSRYNLLILDNPVTAISDTNGARTNIKDELAKDLGVIYTKNTLQYDNQQYYAAASKYSLVNEFTYNYLNRNALINTGNSYYIYSNLDSNGDLAQNSTYLTNYLTKSNEGTITRYPYQINQAVKGSANSYSNYAAADFGITGQKLIGWYCLSDARSPVITNLYHTGTSDSNLYKGMYSSSPNDVKNNYYLFSNGLCYYSGITLSTADTAGNDEEIKLFVNTIIAAYQSSGRVVSSPPVITFRDPVPDTEDDLSKSITITEEDITGTDFILKFEISQSSSKMDLSVLLNGSVPDGSWADTVYEAAADGSLGTAVAVNNTDKIVDNKTYALKIPLTAIQGTNVLSLTATNVQGNITTEQVTLKYAEKPVVTIEDPVPLSNASAGYLYVDIDFNAVDTSEDYLNAAEDLRIVFRVDKTQLKFKIEAASEGEPLTDGSGTDITVYSLNGSTEELLDLTQIYPKGLYVMYIPVALMKDHNSRKITITATDTIGNTGEASVTLLRRSLFPLD